MHFSVITESPTRQKSDCIVVAVHTSRSLSPAAEALDRSSRGALTDQLKIAPMSGKVGEVLTLYGLRGVAAGRVVLLGAGSKRGISPEDYARAVGQLSAELIANGSTSAAVYLEGIEVEGRDATWCQRRLVLSASDATYRFDETKSRGERAPRPKLKRMQIAVGDRDAVASVRAALRIDAAIAGGVSLARDLGNRPGNLCTPTHLAEQAEALAGSHDSLTARVLDEAEMSELGMGSLLSVAAGSRQPAKLVVLEYDGGAEGSPPVVLVGKGVTFDTGGISLKPAGTMDEMKFDMCGAASVLGVLQAAAEMKLGRNVVGIIPATENMPDGQATKPGDVVTSMSGQTIEILNTDAEGRLILCDAITYAERYSPDVVIDIATLTGACVIALGAPASGLFSNDDALADALLRAGQDSGDRAWRMPLWKDYEDQLKSNFADVANVGGREAGAVTAACFLGRFARKLRWAHLDIAGAAWRSGKSKGATGRPVPLLCQYLLARSQD